MATIFPIKRNDTGPPIEGSLRHKGGKAALPLPPGTSVRFIMRAKNATTAKVNAPAVIDDATTGQVHYDWQAADTDTIGVYDAEWEVTFTSGQVVTCPNDDYLRVNVRADLG